MFAVTTVTTRSGAATAEALLKQGEKVRVVLDDEARADEWRRKHAEVVLAPKTDAAALAKALTGAKGVALELPFEPAAAEPLKACAAAFAPQLAALKSAGIKRAVFLSAAGAQHPTGTGPLVALHDAEKALKAALPALTVIRAAPFVEAWAELALGALETGQLPHLGHANVKFAQCSALDVGPAAAKALATEASGFHLVELTGKESWSADDVAEVLTSLLGTPIKAVGLPVEQALATFLARGASAAWAALLTEQLNASTRGQLSFAHPHQALHGTTTLFDALKGVI